MSEKEGGREREVREGRRVRKGGREREVREREVREGGEGERGGETITQTVSPGSQCALCHCNISL